MTNTETGSKRLTPLASMVRVKVNTRRGNTDTVQFKRTEAELGGSWVMKQHKGLTDAPRLSYYLCLSRSRTDRPVHVKEQKKENEREIERKRKVFGGRLER